MFGTHRLATATSAHQYNGLIASAVQHVSVGNLSAGIDVRGHVLLLTAFEDLDDLSKYFIISSTQ
jgi:hypothetical protein